jgi:diadenosine tetraphosphatase ApaH/serine/threonine PP2A family protein phosphatase
VGNHDLAAIGSYDLSWFNPFARAAIRWTAEQLSPEQNSYLSSLPPTAQVEEAMLVHGSYPETMDYITTVQDARKCFEATTSTLTFVGHTHVAEYYRTRPEVRLPEQISLRSGGRISLAPDLRYIINPGAIGQPRDGEASASFGLWDISARTVETRRVPYDVERAQQKMERAGLPESLAARLARGR